MNKLIITILFLLMSFITYSQNSGNPLDKNYAVKYDNEANFEGGIEELSKIILKSINNQDINISGIKSLELSIDILSDGVVGNVIFLDSIDTEIQKNIVNALQQIKFNPATVNGFKVRQNIILVIPISN